MSEYSLHRIAGWAVKHWGVDVPQFVEGPYWTTVPLSWPIMDLECQEMRRAVRPLLTSDDELEKLDLEAAYSEANRLYLRLRTMASSLWDLASKGKYSGVDVNLNLSNEQVRMALLAMVAYTDLTAQYHIRGTFMHAVKTGLVTDAQAKANAAWCLLIMKLFNKAMSNRLFESLYARKALGIWYAWVIAAVVVLGLAALGYAFIHQMAGTIMLMITCNLMSRNKDAEGTQKCLDAMEKATRTMPTAPPSPEGEKALYGWVGFGIAAVVIGYVGVNFILPGLSRPGRVKSTALVLT